MARKRDHSVKLEKACLEPLEKEVGTRSLFGSSATLAAV